LGIEKAVRAMNEGIIAKAAEVIRSKTGYIGRGMEGYCALAVIDEDGYPSASTLTISKADGINWITFLSGLGSNKAKRINKCNRGSVCINSPAYNITLVGTLEVLTDPDIKKEMWQDPLGHFYSGPDDPEYCVIRFRTERYSLFFADDGSKAEGTL
jgi:general stress protein 26